MWYCYYKKKQKKWGGANSNNKISFAISFTNVHLFLSLTEL